MSKKRNKSKNSPSGGADGASAVNAPKRVELVVNQITMSAPQRKTSDVGEWRTALRAFDTGNPKRLYDLYEDLEIDGVLYDAGDKRIGAVINSLLTFQDGKGEEVDEMNRLMEQLDFDELLRQILLTRFWGRSGVEFDFSDGFRVMEIPKKFIDLGRKVIYLNSSDQTGVSYEGDDHILVLGKPNDAGLYLKTAPFAIWKRGGFGDYAQWLELFGMPQRVGKYSSYDPESRLLLEEALKNAGSAPWCVIPKESEVETVNNTGSGSSGTSFDDFRRACNEEMLITILGQTMTTLDGSSRAQSEVHKQVEEGKNKADMRYVQAVLNQHVLPILERRGYPVRGGRFLFPEAAEELSVADLVQLSEIIDIPASYVHGKYSIPMPKDGEAVARRRTEAAGSPIQGKKGKPEKPVSKENLSDTERGWFMQLFDRFFAFAPTLRSGAFRNWSKTSDGNTAALTLADADTDISIDIDALVNKALREIYFDEDKRREPVNEHLFGITYGALQSGIGRELATIDDDGFRRQFRHNAAVFSAFKNHLQTEEIVSLLTDGEGRLRPFHQFKKLALQVSEKYNVRWLQTEYNTAVHAARMAANMKQWEATEHLYPNLEYLHTTAATPDEEHLEYVGTVLPIRHEAWRWLLPPKRWGCQCRVRPTDKPVTAVPKQGTDIDPAFVHDPRKGGFVDVRQTAYYKHTEEEQRERIEAEAERLQKAILQEQRKETLDTAKRKMAGRTVFNKSFGFDIGFTVKGIKDAINNPSDNIMLKFAAIRQMDKLLKKAEYIKSAPNTKLDTKPHVVRYHYFKASLDGTAVYIVVEENKRGEYNFYSVVDKIKEATG